MTALPFIQAPTLPQVVSVYTLVRFGRKIVAKGELTPDDAIEFRALMNRTSTVFELPFANDDDTAEQSIVRREMEHV